MFNINKGTRGQSAKSRLNHKKLITDILSFFLSTRFRLVFIIAVMSIISTISAVKAVKYSYTTSLVEARKAYVNNEAVLIAAEFTKYGSIEEAHNDGVYENLMNYSSLNAIRIRLVDKKYNISVDTYAVDTGKTMINSKVITVYDSPKTITDYSKKTGNIEAASPVYNSEGQLIAVLVVNLDISDISLTDEMNNGCNPNATGISGSNTENSDGNSESYGSNTGGAGSSNLIDINKASCVLSESARTLIEVIGVFNSCDTFDTNSDLELSSSLFLSIILLKCFANCLSSVEPLTSILLSIYPKSTPSTI
jgi:hypothetical protein